MHLSIVTRPKFVLAQAEAALGTAETTSISDRVPLESSHFVFPDGTAGFGFGNPQMDGELLSGYVDSW